MTKGLTPKVSRTATIGRDALVRGISRDQVACGLGRTRIASVAARSGRKASAAARLLADLVGLDRLLAGWAAAVSTGPAVDLDVMAAAQWARGRQLLVTIIRAIPLAALPSKWLLAPRRRGDVIVTDTSVGT